MKKILKRLFFALFPSKNLLWGYYRKLFKNVRQFVRFLVFYADKSHNIGLRFFLTGTWIIWYKLILVIHIYL